ncbi:MAG: histidine--tRNA ligase [bacterium]
MLKKLIKKEINNEIPVRREKKFFRLRGMKDILFDEYKYWNVVTKKANDLAEVYGFKGIATPVLERLELYEKSTGKETDIVSKEMYLFIDKSGDKVALRPEATPGIARAYIEQGMFNLPQPVKTYWFGPVFRHDKPQAGRYRQHSQINFDIFGEEGPVADSQLILIVYNIFSELQIDVQIQINSIGCEECREEYVIKLVEFYKERGKRSKLCNDCKRRFVKNPLRLLDCKEDECRNVAEGAPQIVDFLCEDCRDHFIRVLEYLDEMNIPYNLDPFLVRGLDYYNRTVFEVVPAKAIEGELKRQDSFGGGGRYDGLIEHMGGRPTFACGFGIGVERLVAKIKEGNIPITDNRKNLIFIAQLGEGARKKVFLLFEEMRRTGYNIAQSFTKDSLKAQLEDANALGARFSLILGQKELLDGTIIIRDMEAGTQEVVDYKKIYNEINKRIKDAEEA